MNDRAKSFRDDEEVTSRTKLVQEFDIFRDGSDKRIKRVHWWVQALGGFLVALIVVGIKVGFFLSDVAHREEVDAMRLQMARYEVGQQYLIEQVREIARAAHAPVLPTPRLEPPAILKEQR